MFEPFQGYLTDTSLMPVIPKADANRGKDARRWNGAEQG
jgi:hypothetical protein